MIDNQFGRRDLEDYQRCELEFEKEKLRSGKRNNQYTAGREISNEKCKDNASPASSRDPAAHSTVEPKQPHEESAEDAGVSPATYKRAKYIHKNADESIKQKLRDGHLEVKQLF